MQLTYIFFIFYRKKVSVDESEKDVKLDKYATNGHVNSGYNSTSDKDIFTSL